MGTCVTGVAGLDASVPRSLQHDRTKLKFQCNVRYGKVARKQQFTDMKTPPEGGVHMNFQKAEINQSLLAKIDFLVRYNSDEKISRNMTTMKPVCLRSSICGSAAHIRKAEMSCAYWSTVSGLPSS